MKTIRKLSILLIMFLLIGCSAETLPQTSYTVTPETATVPFETTPLQTQSQTPPQTPSPAILPTQTDVSASQTPTQTPSPAILPTQTDASASQTPIQTPSPAPLPTQTDASTSEQDPTTPIAPPIHHIYWPYFHLCAWEDACDREIGCASCLSLSLLKDIRGYRLPDHFFDVSEKNIGRQRTVVYIVQPKSREGVHDAEGRINVYFDLWLDGIPDGLKRGMYESNLNDWSCFVEQDTAQSHDNYRCEVWYRLYTMTPSAPSEQNSIWYLVNDAKVTFMTYNTAEMYVCSDNMTTRCAAFYKNAVASGYPESDMCLQIAILFIKESEDGMTNDIVYWAMAPLIEFDLILDGYYYNTYNTKTKFYELLSAASPGEPDKTEETVDIRPLLLQYKEKYTDGFMYYGELWDDKESYDLEKCYVLDETMHNTR